MGPVNDWDLFLDNGKKARSALRFAESKKVHAGVPKPIDLWHQVYDIR